jgi:5-methylcytosine-specific restriction endonuclease McrA
MPRGRPAGPKTRNGGQWTEARFASFVKNGLRATSRKWNPIHKTKADARRGRGLYECAGCGQIVPPTKKVGKKRINNVFVDHINPIVDPTKGFTTWDDYVERLFCEQDNLQLLCGECHDKKSMAERALAAKHRKKN